MLILRHCFLQCFWAILKRSVQCARTCCRGCSFRAVRAKDFVIPTTRLDADFKHTLIRTCPDVSYSRIYFICKWQTFILHLSCLEVHSPSTLNLKLASSQILSLAVIMNNLDRDEKDIKNGTKFVGTISGWIVLILSFWRIHTDIFYSIIISFKRKFSLFRKYSFQVWIKYV